VSKTSIGSLGVVFLVGFSRVVVEEANDTTDVDFKLSAPAVDLEVLEEEKIFLVEGMANRFSFVVALRAVRWRLKELI